MTQPSTRVLFVRHGRSTFNDQGRYQGSSDESVLTPKGRKDAQLVGHYLNQKLAYRPIDLVYTSPLKRVQQTANIIVQSLAPNHRPHFLVSTDLKEISLSLWEGLTYEQVKQKYPKQYQRWQQSPAAFELPRPESHCNKRNINKRSTLERSAYSAAASTYVKNHTSAALKPHPATAAQTYFPVQQLYQSAKQFWKTLLSHHAGKTILIVSHSGTIHALISTALNISAEHHHSLQQSNCGISALTFRAVTSNATSPTIRSNVNSRNNNDHFNRDYSVELNQLNQTSAIGEKLPKLKVSKTGLRLVLLSEDGLSPQRCERLAIKMRQFPFDFCLASADFSERSRLLMQPHTEAAFLDAQSFNFSKPWRQWIKPDRNSKVPMTEKLTTGLVIASTNRIQNLLSQTLGCETHGYRTSFTPQQLEVAPQRLSVIHYAYAHRPVLQAMNIF